MQGLRQFSRLGVSAIRTCATGVLQPITQRSISTALRPMQGRTAARPALTVLQQSRFEFDHIGKPVKGLLTSLFDPRAIHVYSNRVDAKR